MTIEEFMKENTRLRHAIQTGIEYEKEYNPQFLTPKHMRVGIDCNQVELAAIVHLLVEKGIIKETEYFEYSLRFMKLEVENCERRLSEKYNVKITLG